MVIGWRGRCFRKKMNTVQIARLEELEKIIDKNLRAFIDCGRCFIEIKESGLYKEKYTTFANYCERKWGFSLNYAEKLMRTVRTEDVLRGGEDTRTIVRVPENEAQSRELNTLSDEDKKVTWEEAVKTAPGGLVTAAHVNATRERLFPKNATSESSRVVIAICPDCGHEHECPQGS